MAGSAAAPSTPVILASSLNSSSVSQPVTLTVSTTTGVTGKVTFYDGAAILGFGVLVGGQATLVTPFSAPGIHTLRAHYSGDSNHPPQDSAPLVQTVNALPGNVYQPVVSGLPVNASIAFMADFNGDGKLDLAVGVGIVPAPNGIAAAIFLGRGDGTFQPAASYPGNILAIGDFNADGKIDFISSASATSPNVTVFLGNGDGTFRQGGIFPSGGQFDSVAVADFNGDGNADLITGLANTRFLLVGNGDGTFQPPVSFSLLETVGPPPALQVADFNLDGKADFYSSYVHLGKGDGTFQPPIITPFALGIAPIGDFNGDGIPDFLSNNGFLEVIIGNGDGTFRAPLASPAPPGLSGLLAGDFNGDGKLDALSVSSAGAWLSFGNGDGTFQPPVNITTQAARAVFAGDLNGDGRTDFILQTSDGNLTAFLASAFPDFTVAATHSGTFSPGTAGTFTISVGNAGAGFSSGVVIVTDALPPSVTLANLSAGGWACTGAVVCTRLDSLAPGAAYPPITLNVNVGAGVGGTISNTVTVSGGGEVNVANDSVTDAFTVRPATVTLSTSPNPSILGQAVTLTATVPGASGRISFYDGVTKLGTGAVVGAVASITTRLLAEGTHSLQARFEPDSNSLFGPGTSANVLQTVSELPANSFQPVVSYATPQDALCIAQGDFNGDGRPDLVVSGESSVSVFLGRGDGSFGLAVATSPVSLAGFGCNLVVADFNGDGKSDLLRSGNLALGNGDGTFQPAVTIGPVFGNPAVADFNGDGKADVAFVNNNAGGLTLLLGNGDGTFAAPINYFLAEAMAFDKFGFSNVFNLVAGDFNGDGKADLALATRPFVNATTLHVMVLPGNGDGTFQAPMISQTGVTSSGIGFVFVADFNLDGKPDLAINYLNSSQATVLLGKGDGTFQPSTVSYPGVLAGVGDLNGDGRPDLMTYLASNNNRLQVLLGKGDGTFQGPIVVPSGGGPGAAIVGDFNGDGKADVAVANGIGRNVGVLLGLLSRLNLTVWQPANGNWYVNPASGALVIQQWGVPGDIPVAADFDGDGILDFAAWRPSNGTWYIIPSASPSVPLTRQWGLSGDIPVAGDFDGDGRADFAVWRPSNGTWYILPSGGGAAMVKQWGVPGDIPVLADFDGDGKADFVVWRPSEANWYIVRSSTGATMVRQWGVPSDVPVAADFDGDGKADFAVWRPAEANWYIIPSGTGQPYIVQWGLPGDVPAPRDYDLDGKADLAVWRPSNGTWYISLSGMPQTPLIVQWGVAGEVPVYKPVGK